MASTLRDNFSKITKDVKDSLVASAKSEMSIYFKDYCDLCQECATLGWKRLASHACWPQGSPELQNKLEFCIVASRAVESFSPERGHFLKEGEDYFTSRWHFWSVMRKNPESESSVEYQMLAAKNKHNYDGALRALNNKREREKKAATISARSGANVAGIVEQHGGRDWLDEALWNRLHEDLRFDCNVPVPAPNTVRVAIGAYSVSSSVEIRSAKSDSDVVPTADVLLASTGMSSTARGSTNTSTTMTQLRLKHHEEMGVDTASLMAMTGRQQITSNRAARYGKALLHEHHIHGSADHYEQKYEDSYQFEPESEVPRVVLNTIAEVEQANLDPRRDSDNDEDLSDGEGERTDQPLMSAGSRNIVNIPTSIQQSKQKRSTKLLGDTSRALSSLGSTRRIDFEEGMELSDLSESVVHVELLGEMESNSSDVIQRLSEFSNYNPLHKG